MEIVFLSLFAFLAGFIDSVVGGGGLIQVPALFGILPNTHPAVLLGTNKIASVCGTSVAAWRYVRAVEVRWDTVIPAAVLAFVFSFIGAAAVSYLPGALIRPVVLILLVLVAIYTFMRKDFGAIHAPRHAGMRERVLGGLVGMALGFYDGFFGPGTGSFLMFLFIRFFGFDFLGAAASAKVVNVATNLAAILYFVPTGNYLLAAAVPMAACNILGAVLGARMAVRRGAGFVRVLFLVVLVVMILKLAYDTVVDL